jgi:hypothetical protein
MDNRFPKSGKTAGVNQLWYMEQLLGGRRQGKAK